MVNKKLFMAFCGILADKDDDAGCWSSSDDDCDKDDEKDIANELR